jgi:hypothetical protein
MREQCGLIKYLNKRNCPLCGNDLINMHPWKIYTCNTRLIVGSDAFFVVHPETTQRELSGKIGQ